MANIAGGFSAVGALEGARDYRASEAQNIQNQNAQMDLDTKRDMQAGYEAYAQAVARQRERSAGAAQNAQIPQQPKSALRVEASPSDAVPLEGGYSADPNGGGSVAPAQPAPSAVSPAPAQPAPKIDPQTAELAKRFGVDPADLAGVKMTPGFMQGMALAAQHREEQQKEGMKQGINRMSRILATRPEAEQREGVASFLRENGLAGAPTGFAPTEDGKGWYALHSGDKPADIIPNSGGGFLDSITRMLYGAVDRYGTIGAGIEAETKLAPERVKAKSALDVQESKNKGYREKAEIDNTADKEIAHIQGDYRVKAAGVSATAGNKADTAAEKARAKKIDQRIKTLEQQRKGLEKDPITGQYKDAGSARRIDQELQDLRAELTGDDAPQRSRPRSTKHFSQYE